MIDDTHDHDSTDTQATSTDRSPDEDDAGVNRRGFLKKTAATAIAGVTGANVATGSAVAASNTFKILGKGQGPHEYRVSGSGFSYGQSANPSAGDTIINDDVIEGILAWDYGKDTYQYDHISTVSGNGHLEFKFPDGIGNPNSDTNFIMVTPNGNDERTPYEIETETGDIDLGSLSNPDHDTDVGGYVQEHYAGDTIEGIIWGGTDNYDYYFGKIHRIRIDGSAKFFFP